MYIFKKVCVLGLGYIGLPTASLLANTGFNVIGVDKKENLIGIINNGGVHIEEPGLKALVNAAVNSKRLEAKNKAEEADVFFIAVPTPLKASDNKVEVDLCYVAAAAEEISKYLANGNLVILESTSPPGTTKDIVAPILEKSGLKAGTDFYLAHCPERVLPGNTLRELIQNNRIIGGINNESAEKAKALYKRFIEGEISTTDATTAEMAKLIENTYRDVNIALANEISCICEKVGINAWEVIKLANLHPRVNLHLPGPGVGGHCISVDPWFIISAFKEEAKVIALGRQINDQQPKKVLEALKSFLEGISDPVVTILGVAYKGNIDDIRESPALKVIEGLDEAGIRFKIYDPHVSNFDYETKSLKEAFKDSDCLVVLTDHDEFSYIYPKELAGLMRTRQVYDTRNCLDKQLWESNGFKYYLLGAGSGGKR
jgi:UDP-N-acetyl-D-mannosaminuronic acid dehydrogenase